MEILTVVMAVAALISPIWLVGKFFRFENYVQINLMMHRTECGRLEIILQNNGHKGVRFDEFGIYVLGTPIPIKDVTCEKHEISSLEPFRLSLVSESLKQTIDRKLAIANQKYKSYLREECCEFRFYIKTANKLRLTLVWFSKEDVFAETGSGLRDLVMATFNKKIDYRYPVEEENTIISTLTLLPLLVLLLAFAIEIGSNMLLFLTIVALPALLICPITFVRTKRGLWARRHTWILITILCTLTACLAAICFYGLDLNEYAGPAILFTFTLALYSSFLMPFNYLRSVFLKDAIKRYNSKKYDFEQTTNEAEEADSQ